MNSFYYVSETSANERNAGSKARQDVEFILNKCGLQPLNDKPIFVDKNRTQLLPRMNFLLKVSQAYSKILKKIRNVENSKFILQYPLVGHKLSKRFLKKLNQNNEVVLFIHDVGYLRGEEAIDEELKTYSDASYLIVHNDVMKQEFIRVGIDPEKIKVLEIFDYLVFESFEPREIAYPGDTIFAIDFAGNLGKSHFLNELKQHDTLGFTLNLYGIGYDESMNTRFNDVKYFGSFDPEVLLQSMVGHFGLVWDGSGLDSGGEDRFGNYMLYNNPHKLSLYLASGKPVIVWKKAAIARFVEEHNVGICVDSLFEVNEKLQLITEDEYLEMRWNTCELSKKLTTGYFTEKVIEEVCNV